MTEEDERHDVVEAADLEHTLGVIATRAVDVLARRPRKEQAAEPSSVSILFTMLGPGYRLDLR